VTAVAGARPRWRWRSSRRRTTELGLLVLGALITVGAYVLAALGKTATLPSHTGAFLAVVLGLGLAAHIATRVLAPDADPVLLPLVALLNGLGYVFIARLNYKLAGLQSVWSALGVGAYIATLVLVRRSRDLERYRYLLMLAGLGLMLAPLAPVIGRTINGARLWVRLGSVSFQPVELAKIALAIFFASYFVEKRSVLAAPTLRIGNRLVPDPRPMGPLLLAWGLSLVVMTAERDIGFSLLFFVMFIVMLWVSTGRMAYLLVGAVLFVLGALLAMHLFGHVHERITIWLNPWPHRDRSGYQIVQAQYALGTGGLAGSGLGLGRPQLIPVVASDFIFAAIGEELGLLGTSAIIFSFVLFVGAGLRTALRARSEFASLLAAGYTAVVGFQAFFIMAGVVRLLPLTGVTLPFVAYGGSSLVANYVILALLQRISAETQAPAPVPPRT
jgi:peptidoglycan glycosyltransferase